MLRITLPTIMMMMTLVFMMMAMTSTIVIIDMTKAYRPRWDISAFISHGALLTPTKKPQRCKIKQEIQEALSRKMTKGRGKMMNRGVANGDMLLMMLKMARGITMMNKGGC